MEMNLLKLNTFISSHCLYINDFSANHINYWCWCDLFALEQYVIHVRKIFFNLPHSLLTFQLINFSVVTFLHAQFCPDIFSLLYIHTNLLIKWIFFIITLNKSFNMMKTHTYTHFVCIVHSIFVNSLIIIGFNFLLFLEFMIDVFELMQWHCNDFDQPQSSIVVHLSFFAFIHVNWTRWSVIQFYPLTHLYRTDNCKNKNAQKDDKEEERWLKHRECRTQRRMYALHT